MSFLYRVFDKLALFILYTFTIAVITLAVISSFLRYYLPQIDHYREDLLALVAEKTAWQVDAKRISAQWRQFKPKFELYQLSLAQQESGHQVQLEYLKLELNIAKSLYYQTVYLETAALGGLEVVLLQDEQGGWGFTSSKQTKRALAVEDVVEHLWSIGSFELQELSLTMIPYQQEAIHFPQLSASLSSRLNGKILQIDIDEEQQNRSHLVIETANYFKDEDFSAEIYWRTHNFPLHVLLPFIDHVEVHSESRVSQELWLSWRDGQPSGVGNFSLDSLAIDYQDKPWLAESGQGSFYLDTENGVTTLGIPSLSFTLNEQHVQLDKIKFERQKDQQKLQIEHINLAEIDSYLSLIDLPERLQELREDLAAKGELSHLLLEIDEDDFLLRANLHDVSVGAWTGAPALQHVSGYVEATKYTGFVEFDTPQFVMAFPQLYDGTMEFKQSQGAVYWQVDDSVKVGSIGQIKLAGLYGQAVGEFALEIPLGVEPDNPTDVGRIALLIDLKNADARYRNDLIPAILDEGLLDWLDNSILDAWVNRGSFIYHGPIVDHAEEEKVVQLWLDVDDATIRFHPDFAFVEAIQGEFLLDQLSAQADIRTAQSLGMRLEKAQLEMDLAAETPFVQVSTALNESSRKVLNYLQQDFITQLSGGVIEQWQADQGQVKADIEVFIPVQQVEQTQVSVRAGLADVKLDLQQPNLVFEHISGDFNYDTTTGFSAQQLQGMLWGDKLMANIDTAQGQSRLQFEYQQAQIEKLKAWLELPLLGFFKGKTDVRGRLEWGEVPAQLTLSSQLQGVSVELPEPFSKLADEQSALELVIPLEDGFSELELYFGDKHAVYLQFDEQSLSTGNIALNSQENKPFRLGEIQVYGALEYASIEEWITAVNQYLDYSADSSWQDSSLDLQINHLMIEQVNLWSFPLQQLNLSLKEENKHWQFQFATEYFDGQLAVPITDEQIMQLQFHDLDLAFLQQEGISQESEELSRKEVNFEPIQIGIDQLRLGEQFFGQWQLSVEAEHDLVLFNHIEALVRDMRLSAISEDLPCRLTWSLVEYEQSKFDCRLTSDRIDQSLKAWGFERSVYAEQFEAVIHDAVWQGSPAEFDILNSTVPFNLSLKDGYFADVDSASTDALKALGFFNLSNLVRRLKLDFKDLSQEGLTFDRVKGQLLLEQGVVSSDSPLLIKGSASEIKITGQGDFNQSLLDLDMSVSLPLVSNLPWIVALAAGLPAAVGVFVVSKIMGKQVDKLSTAVYHISGDMEQPKVKFKRLFDVEKDKKRAK